MGHIARDIVETPLGSFDYWGGGAFHVAIGASLYLHKGEVVIDSVAGSDFDSIFLERIGVDISLLNIDTDVVSDRHWLNEKEKSRGYLAEGNLYQMVNLKNLQNIPKEQIGWIHFASSSPQQQFKWINQLRQIGWDDVPRSCDTFEKYAINAPLLVREAMTLCSLGFVNNMEWKAIKASDLKIPLVRKRGSLGGEYYEEGKRVFRVSTSKISSVKDTTGAGDVLAGVFISLRLRGETADKALFLACQAATRSVGDFGTTHLVEDEMG